MIQVRANYIPGSSIFFFIAGKMNLPRWSKASKVFQLQAVETGWVKLLQYRT